MPSALLGRAPGRGGRLPLPSRPPPGPTSPQARAHSPSAPRFPAAWPRHLRQPHTPGAARPARPAPLPGRGSAGRTPADGPAGGKFPRRKEEGRGGAGRGGGGGEEKGRQRKGSGGERGLRGVCSPAGNGSGDRFQGPAPRQLITTIIIMRRMEFCLGAKQWAKSFTVFFHLLLLIIL